MSVAEKYQGSEDIANHRTADAQMVELLSRYALLMEQLLLDLQMEVRSFVARMNDATVRLDGQVTEEGERARSLFESIFEETQKESHVLNSRAAARVDDIMSELLESGGVDGVSEELKSTLVNKICEASEDEMVEQHAQDSVWSKVSKSLESVARLEERLRPQVYSIIECLGFEDIQTQRLDHLLSGFKELNGAVSNYLKEGESVLEGGTFPTFANNFLNRIRGRYTMESERNLFDSVFKPIARKK